MQKTRVLSFLFTTVVGLGGALVVSAPAHAQEAAPVSTSAGRLGLGVAQTFDATGIDLVFDGGPWHANTTLALAGGGGTVIDMLVHGWFHLHNGASSDFSVGGGLGVHRVDPSGAAPTLTQVAIDMGFQLRAFVTANVAAGGFGGLRVFAGDGDGFQLSGQPVATFSVTYFF